MAWWTKIQGKVKKHDGRQPKFSAALAVNVAVNMSGVPVEECGLYKRDPEKHPDEPNLLPGELVKARARATRKAIGGGR